MLIIAGILIVGFLVGKFWNNIRDFLNTKVRDSIDKIFGEQQQWFVNFIMFLDGKIVCPTKRLVGDWWKKFNDNVVTLDRKYKENANGGYDVTTVTTVRLTPTEGEQTVVKENLDWAYLPDNVRNEMIGNKLKEAQLDMKDAVKKKAEKQTLAMEQ